MHRQDVPRRQLEIEIAEHRLLDLAGVGSAADQDQPLSKIDEDEDIGVDLVELRDGEEFRGVQDRESGLETFKLLDRRADEHVARKEAVPRAVGNHPDRQAVSRIGPGIEVLDKNLAPLEISEHPLVDALEALGSERLIDLSPPHGVFGAALLDNVLVPRGAAGIETGADWFQCCVPRWRMRCRSSPKRLLAPVIESPSSSNASSF